MPRLNPNLARAVFFLYGRNPRDPDNLIGPVASGLIICPSTPGTVLHLYALTSAHTAPRGASVIRLNTRDGKSRLIDLEPDEWQFIPGGADMSAVDITDRIDPKTDDISCVPIGYWGGKEFIKTVALGPGEDGFMLGLFSNHAGEHRNMVAARFGNLSMVASEEAPIKQPNGSKRPSHLFDMRSRGGFSGSPVFVYRTPEGDLRQVEFGGRRRTTKAPDVTDFGGRGPVRGAFQQRLQWDYEHDLENNMFVSLLGIHAGQYPEPVVAKKVQKAHAHGEADAILDGDKLEIPSGMTIVVPIWEAHELLALEVFVAQRKAREARLEAFNRNDPIPESAEGMEALTAPEPDNLSHKEDFTRLLGAAAKANK